MRLKIDRNLAVMCDALGMGTMATQSHNLYHDLVMQFMAYVRVYYSNERVKEAAEGTFTFLIRCIRYKIPIHDLCNIYGFHNRDYTCTSHHAAFSD